MGPEFCVVDSAWSSGKELPSGSLAGRFRVGFGTVACRAGVGAAEVIIGNAPACSGNSGNAGSCSAGAVAGVFGAGKSNIGVAAGGISPARVSAVGICRVLSENGPGEGGVNVNSEAGSGAIVRAGVG